MGSITEKKAWPTYKTHTKNEDKSDNLSGRVITLKSEPSKKKQKTAIAILEKWIIGLHDNYFVFWL